MARLLELWEQEAALLEEAAIREHLGCLAWAAALEEGRAGPEAEAILEDLAFQESPTGAASQEAALQEAAGLVEEQPVA